MIPSHKIDRNSANHPLLLPSLARLPFSSYSLFSLSRKCPVFSACSFPQAPKHTQNISSPTSLLVSFSPQVFFSPVASLNQKLLKTLQVAPQKASTPPSVTETLLYNGFCRFFGIFLPRVDLSLVLQFHYSDSQQPTRNQHVALWNCDTWQNRLHENRAPYGGLQNANLTD